MSNIRIYPKNEDGYLKMQMFCNEMNILTDDDHEFYVKDGYFDENLDWKWSAPCCHGKNGRGKETQWWVCSTTEYDSIIEASDFSEIQKIANKIVNRMRDKETSIPGQKSPYGQLLSNEEISAKRAANFIKEDDTKIHILYDDMANPTQGLVFVSDFKDKDISNALKANKDIINSFTEIQMTAGFTKLLMYVKPEKINTFLEFAKKHGIDQSDINKYSLTEPDKVYNKTSYAYSNAPQAKEYVTLPQYLNFWSDHLELRVYEGEGYIIDTDPMGAGEEKEQLWDKISIADLKKGYEYFELPDYIFNDMTNFLLKDDLPNEFGVNDETINKLNEEAFVDWSKILWDAGYTEASDYLQPYCDFANGNVKGMSNAEIYRCKTTQKPPEFEQDLEEDIER